MLESLVGYLQGRTLVGLLRDALDIFVVYYAAYRGLLVLRGTRAMQVGIGLTALIVLYVVARLLELTTVLAIMSTLLSSLLLIIVVVFQNDIRRALQRIGSQAFFARFTRGPETKVIDEVVEAATELARHRIGAVITFEQDANLDEFVGVHKGHVIDARVSRELLVSLFVPEGINKLHDGSVIIRNLRIAKAGVFFPMPEQRVTDESFGSRHRAALGITEETDAVVVVVSEERGTISFCFNGNIASNIDGPRLRTMLEAVFSPKAAQRKSARRRAVAVATPVPSDGRLTTDRTDTASDRRPEPAPEAPIRTRIPIDPEPPTALRTLGASLALADATRSPDSERPAPLRRGAMISQHDLDLVARPRITGSAELDSLPTRRQRDSEPPPPLRRASSAASEPPAPLRTRTGLEELSGPTIHLPRPARIPTPLRSLLSGRDPLVTGTPVSGDEPRGLSGASEEPIATGLTNDKERP